MRIVNSSQMSIYHKMNTDNRLSRISKLMLKKIPLINMKLVPTTHVASFVEIKFCFRLLHIGSVALLKVLGEDNIPVFADSMHTSFLTDSSNLEGKKKHNANRQPGFQKMYI